MLLLTYVFGQLGHVGLTEPLDLVLTLVVGVEVSTTVRATHVLSTNNSHKRRRDITT